MTGVLARLKAAYTYITDNYIHILTEKQYQTENIGMLVNERFYQLQNVNERKYQLYRYKVGNLSRLCFSNKKTANK